MMINPHLIFKCKLLVPAEFLLPLLKSSSLSSITERRIQTICQNSMLKVWCLQCGCVIPAASIYADSLITHFRKRYKLNVAVGERHKLLLQPRVQ